MTNFVPKEHKYCSRCVCVSVCVSPPSPPSESCLTADATEPLPPNDDTRPLLVYIRFMQVIKYYYNINTNVTLQSTFSNQHTTEVGGKKQQKTKKEMKENRLRSTAEQKRKAPNTINK